MNIRQANEQDVSRIAEILVFNNRVNFYPIFQDDEYSFWDPFFQRRGIGGKLIEFAIDEKQADRLWALEKNTGAIRFYERYGFRLTGEKTFEDGTTEYLVRLER